MDKKMIDACRKATLHFEQITPAIAKQWLLKNTSNYRGKTENTVRKYVTDMTEGLWSTNTATIAFSASGILIDGQHRLEAVVESGVSIWSYVLTNCPNEFVADPNLDKGKLRTAATYLHHEGVKNATTVASALRCLCRLALGFSMTRGGAFSLTDAQVVAAIALLPSQLFDAVATVQHNIVLKRLYKPSIASVAVFLADMHDSESAKAFVSVLGKTTDEPSSHPANVLREFCISNKKLISDDRFLDLFLTAFNLFLKGESRTVLRCNARPEFSQRQQDALDLVSKCVGITEKESLSPIENVPVAAKRSVVK
jgi:hypothetical protein